MMSTALSDLKSILQENIFRAGEKNRLRSMKEQLKEREDEAHEDLLNQLHEDQASADHRKSIEHHGLRFWNYFFEGEHPKIDENLPAYIDEAWDENIRLESHIIKPPFSTVMPEIDGIGEQSEGIEKQWMRHILIAQAALRADDFSEAEAYFRLSLDDAEKLDRSKSRQMAISAKGLADALAHQSKMKEADPFYSVALMIDEQLFGSGDAYLESEFYEIAKHFVDEGNFYAMEALFEDLNERLRMSVGRNDPITIRCLNELAIIYCRDGKWRQAEPLLARCLEKLNKFLPSQRNQIAAIHNNYGALCEALDRHGEAERHYTMALKALQNETDNVEPGVFLSGTPVCSSVPEQ